MLNAPKSLAPEPYLSAVLGVMYHVAIYIRAMTVAPDKIPPSKVQEIHELMNAIHNVPASIIEHGEWFSEQKNVQPSFISIRFTLKRSELSSPPPSMSIWRRSSAAMDQPYNL